MQDESSSATPSGKQPIRPSLSHFSRHYKDFPILQNEIQLFDRCITSELDLRILCMFGKIAPAPNSRCRRPIKIGKRVYNADRLRSQYLERAILADRPSGIGFDVVAEPTTKTGGNSVDAIVSALNNADINLVCETLPSPSGKTALESEVDQNGAETPLPVCRVAHNKMCVTLQPLLIDAVMIAIASGFNESKALDQLAPALAKAAIELFLHCDQPQYLLSRTATLLVKCGLMQSLFSDASELNHDIFTLSDTSTTLVHTTILPAWETARV